MKKLLLFLFILIIVSAALNGLWEYGQCGIFYTINGEASFEHYNLLIGRIILDIGVTLLLYIFVSIVNFEWKWFANWDLKDTFIILLFALFVSFYVEVNALYLGRWGYSNIMPLLIGTDVGLTPILQWLITMPVSLLIVRLFMRGRVQTSSRYRF
ncbi:MAG TPA: hypothetical protein VKN64_04835 [Halanaerobiales bacterium]|nr:hypothetical protein [Halanaerobiales bacterium]